MRSKIKPFVNTRAISKSCRLCFYYCSAFVFAPQIRFCKCSKLATLCRDSDLPVLFPDMVGGTWDGEFWCPLLTCEMLGNLLLTTMSCGPTGLLGVDWYRWRHGSSCKGTAASVDVSDWLPSSEEMPMEEISDMAWNIGLPVTRLTVSSAIFTCQDGNNINWILCSSKIKYLM